MSQSNADETIVERLRQARALSWAAGPSPTGASPLDAAIHLIGEALRLAVPGHPLCGTLLEDASILLLRRYDSEGREADLDRALPLCRTAVDHTPDSEPDLMARRWITLGNALRRQRRRTGRPADDEEAEVFALAAVTAGPESGYRGNAVNRLLASLEATQPSAHSTALGAALLRRVHRAHPGDREVTDALAHWLAAAAEWLVHDHEEGRPVTELREAAETLGEAARLLDTGAPERSEFRLEQSIVLQSVYRYTSEAAVLDTAVDACCEVSGTASAAPLIRATATARLGEQLLLRHLRTGDPRDLEESVVRWDEAMASPDLPEDVRRWGALGNLEAHDYRVRRLTGPSARRDTVVPLELVTTCSGEDPTRLEPYVPAGDLPRAARRGPVAELVARARAELRACARRADRAGALSAVDAAREAVCATPAGDPGLPPLVVMYADACRLHLTLSQQFVAPDFMARLYRWAARTLAPGDPLLPWTRAKAANVGLAFTQMAGLSDPRDGMIGLLRSALDRASAGDPERGVLLGRLADALEDRYEEVGDLAVLDESIETTRRACQVLTGKEQAFSFRVLAARLRKRFARTQDMGDYAEAMIAARKAHAADPETELTVEELTGIDRHRMRGAVPDEPASRMRRYREALRRARPGDSEALSDLHYFRHLLLGRMIQRANEQGPPETREELDEAVAVYRRLEELTPPYTHYLRTRTINDHGLAMLLRRRYERFADPRDRDEADSVAQRAIASDAFPELRVRAAQVAAQWAADDGRWPRAAEGYRQAVALLPVLAPRQAGRESQEERLKAMFGLASDGAAAALRCGDADSALEVLERGRGLLRGYVTEGHGDFPELTAAGPDGVVLARELRSVADALAVPPSNDRAGAGPDHRHRLARRWDEAVRAARALPGLDDFLRPPRAADLLPGPGATVVLNVSRHRCDALLIQSGKLVVLPLTDLSADEVNTRVSRFVDVLAFAHLVPHDEEAQRMGQRPLQDVLAWLWETAAGPVLDRLGMTRTPGSGEPWPRVWWVPTGMLSFLPVHAAGLPGGPGVLDRAVSSYAVSVRDLRDAQTRAAQRGVPSPALGRLLGVASPHTDGHGPLARAAGEVAAIARHFPRRTVLSGHQATRDAVLAELPRSDWAHFACHAMSNPYRPSESRLLLTGGPLDISALSGKQMSGGMLAYLSACEAARGGLHLSDEGITLASAFRLAGFEHAVAALWAVLDSTAAQTAELFYDAAAAGCDPATALHRAQRKMRDRTPDLPSRWAPYVHAGP